MSLKPQWDTRNRDSSLLRFLPSISFPPEQHYSIRSRDHPRGADYFISIWLYAVNVLLPIFQPRKSHPDRVKKILRSINWYITAKTGSIRSACSCFKIAEQRTESSQCHEAWSWEVTRSVHETLRQKHSLHASRLAKCYSNDRLIQIT